MIINAVRYRESPDSEWKSWRFTPGTNQFRNVFCFHGSTGDIARMRVAIEYALTGETDPLICETSIQISGDDGDTWVVHRTANNVRYLKNGQLQDSEQQQGLLRALLDLDFSDSSVADIDITRTFAVGFEQNRIIVTPKTEEGAIDIKVKEALAHQIARIAGECASTLKEPSLALPKTLSQLTRTLKPMHWQYQETKRLLKSLNEEWRSSENEDQRQSPVPTADDLDKLAREVQLIREISASAQPLMGAGATIKQLRKNHAVISERIEQIAKDIGLEGDVESLSLRLQDWRKPLESLCRLEAYAKLVRASQGSRKACEQRLEPALQGYTAAVRKTLESDRHVLEEVESCLASLNLQIHLDHHRTHPTRLGEQGPPSPRGIAPATTVEQKGSQLGKFTKLGRLTWFDRFKKDSVDSQTEESAPESPQSDLDSARMAVEFTLSKLNELIQRAHTATEPPESAVTRLDDAHEDLVRRYGRAKDHWYQVARKAHLPEDFDLRQLLRLIGVSGRLAGLRSEQHRIEREIHDLKKRFETLAEVVAQWRDISGSARRADLSTPALLITEIRDILAIKAAKERNLARYQKSTTRTRAAEWTHQQLIASLKQIRRDWIEALKHLDVKRIDITNKDLKKVFQQADMMRSLALTHGATSQKSQKLFQETSEAACTLYVWEDDSKAGMDGLSEKHRLTISKQIEAAQIADSPEMRLFLTTDAGLAKTLANLGIGRASLVKSQTRNRENAATAQNSSPSTVGLASYDRVRPPRAELHLNQKKQTPATLDERARKALDILTGGRR